MELLESFWEILFKKERLINFPKVRQAILNY